MRIRNKNHTKLNSSGVNGNPVNSNVNTTSGSRNVRLAFSLLTNFSENILVSPCAGLWDPRLELFCCFGGIQRHPYCP